MKNIISSKPTIHKSFEQIFATDDSETFSTYIKEKNDNFSNLLPFEFNGKTFNVPPLVIATKYHALKCISALVSVPYENNSFTALHLAMNNQWLQGIELLMDKEIRMISCFDFDGLSPLAYLANSQNISLIRPVVNKVLSYMKLNTLFQNPFQLVDNKNNLGFLEYASRHKLSRIINSCSILLKNKLINEDNIYSAIQEWGNDSSIPQFLKLSIRYINSKNDLVDKNSVKPFTRSSPFYQFSYNTYYPIEDIVKSTHDLLICVKSPRSDIEPLMETFDNILDLPYALRKADTIYRYYIPRHLINAYIKEFMNYLDVPSWFSSNITTKYYGPKLSSIDDKMTNYYNFGIMLAHLGFAGCYTAIPHLDPMLYRMLSMGEHQEMDDKEFLSYVCVVDPELYTEYAKSLINKTDANSYLSEHYVKSNFQSRIPEKYIKALRRIAKGFKESVPFSDNSYYKKYIQFITKIQSKLCKENHGSCQPALQAWFEGRHSSNLLFWYQKLDIVYFHPDDSLGDYSQNIESFNKFITNHLRDTPSAFNFFTGFFGITSTIGWRTKLYRLYIIFGDKKINEGRLIHFSEFGHVAIRYDNEKNIVKSMDSNPIRMYLTEFLASYTQIKQFRWNDENHILSEVVF